MHTSIWFSPISRVHYIQFHHFLSCFGGLALQPWNFAMFFCALCCGSFNRKLFSPCRGNSQNPACFWLRKHGIGWDFCRRRMVFLCVTGRPLHRQMGMLSRGGYFEDTSMLKDSSFVSANKIEGWIKKWIKDGLVNYEYNLRSPNYAISTTHFQLKRWQGVTIHLLGPWWGQVTTW